jgi:RNA polymerase sigma factor (sigma-70 family)
MDRTPVDPSPEHVAFLAEMIRDITRARRMRREDAEDFAQFVQLKFLERRYDAFQRFEGRSSLRTYFMVILKRMLLDWEARMYGKWRPTALAVRLGPYAVDLERLINRDRYGVDEAVEIVGRNSGAPKVDELRRMADQLPRRQRSRAVNSDDLVNTLAVSFRDPLLEDEQEATRARIDRSLATAIDGLSDLDRHLIALRYHQKRSVQAVAQLLQIDARALYRRFNRVLRTLRRRLAESGVTGPTIANVQ